MELQTDRLVLRRWRVDEAPRMLDILGREEVVGWLGHGGRPPRLEDLDQARQRIERYTELSAEAPRGLWALEVRGTGVVAGTALLLTLPDAEADEVEIGWHLHPDSWGRGYATEAARAVLTWGFGHGLPEILAVTHPDNGPSMRVCRRLGMRDEGIVDRWYAEPSRLFRLSLTDWLDQRRAEMRRT